MNYKSLNSAIRSVTNPQSKLVKEDYQTRERDRQMANTGQLGSSLDSKEKASKKVYGKDGVVAHKSLRAMIKKANWKDEKNRLAVKEDIQTPQRKAEGEKDIKNLTGTYKRRIKKAAGIPNPHVRSKASDDALERANDALTNLSNRTTKHETERRSTELYGHRGKIIKKKSTVKEEQEYIERLEFALESIAEELECSVEDLLEETKKTSQLSSDQRAAAMKDRNSGIHRTPAELKKFAASRKAYVKSQNNRTDSKGKKLDAYDDYQS